MTTCSSAPEAWSSKRTLAGIKLQLNEIEFLKEVGVLGSVVKPVAPKAVVLEVRVTSSHKRREIHPRLSWVFGSYFPSVTSSVWVPKMVASVSSATEVCLLRFSVLFSFLKSWYMVA